MAGIFGQNQDAGAWDAMKRFNSKIGNMMPSMPKMLTPGPSLWNNMQSGPPHEMPDLGQKLRSGPLGGPNMPWNKSATSQLASAGAPVPAGSPGDGGPLPTMPWDKPEHISEIPPAPHQVHAQENPGGIPAPGSPAAQPASPAPPGLQPKVPSMGLNPSHDQYQEMESWLKSLPDVGRSTGGSSATTPASPQGGPPEADPYESYLRKNLATAQAERDDMNRRGGVVAQWGGPQGSTFIHPALAASGQAERALSDYLGQRRHEGMQSALNNAQIGHLGAESYSLQQQADPMHAFNAVQPFMHDRDAMNAALSMHGMPNLSPGQGPQRTTWAPRDIDEELLAPQNQELAQAQTILGQVRALQKAGAPRGLLVLSCIANTHRASSNTRLRNH